MRRYEAEVIEAAKIHNIEVTNVDNEIANRLRKNLRKYLRQEMDKTLCFVEQPHAWTWIKDYINDSEAIFFYGDSLRDRDSPVMFKVNNGKDLETIIDEVPYEPIYVTSETGNFLLEWNEYDHFIAYLEAIPWLRSYATERGTLLKCQTETENERLARAKLSLEGLALGDAYRNHHGNNAKKHAAQTWEYSDDTLMACSIVQNLWQFEAIRPDELAQSFAEHWDGQRGYGQGVTRLLKAIRHGASWPKVAYEMFDGQGSFGNGAAMRVAPLGAFFADDFQLLVKQASASAIVTHAHPEGIAGAIAVAVAAGVTHQMRVEAVAPNRNEFLSRLIPSVPESEVRRKIVSAMNLPQGTSVETAVKLLGNGRPVHAQLTVPFTLWAAGEFLGNYETAIRKTASARGDVDTNCAIVGGIVILYTGIESLPEKWLARREPLPNWAFQGNDA